MKHKFAGIALAIGLVAASAFAQNTGLATAAVEGVVFRWMQVGVVLSYRYQGFRWTVQHTSRLRVIAQASSHSMQFLLGRTRSMHKHPAWQQIGPSRSRQALLQK